MNRTGSPARMRCACPIVQGSRWEHRESCQYSEQLSLLVLRLQLLREASGMTQLQVSGMSGLEVKTLSAYERGYRADSIKFIHLERLLTKAYGITLADFFGWDPITMDAPA